MAWKQIEATGPHVSYLLVSLFLLVYALFSLFIRNRLHLSEPPLATLFGIIFGERGAPILTPRRWGFDDYFVQEYTRIILGIQCFTVGIELPERYILRRWKSIAMLIGPVMSFSWLIVAFFIWLLFPLDFPTTLIISACLAPTDPILAGSVLGNSQFAARIPSRLRNLLSCESACNDGSAFPFLYIGLFIVMHATAADTLKHWFLITILWQCGMGILLGLIVGRIALALIRYAADHEMISRAAYVVFYLLLAIFSIGIASTLGLDDFLVAFSAGAAFAADGWFASQTVESNFSNIVELLLNSTMFVYLGASMPWEAFTFSWSMNEHTGKHHHNQQPITEYDWTSLPAGRLLVLLVLILAFRRIPAILATYRFTPDIATWAEALFCGHMGPMGVGALFLAMEARAQLETGTSEPLPHPPTHGLSAVRLRAIQAIWPIICFVVLGSVMVHGLSTLGLSVAIHFARPKGERAPLIAAETDGLDGMLHSSDSEDD